MTMQTSAASAPGIRTVLALVDFSEATARVESFAAAMASRFGARLCLLHVAPPEPDFIGYRPGPQSVRDGVAEAWRAEHARLHEMAERLRGRGLDAFALQVQGPLVDVVVDQARRLDADLVVASFHRHGVVHRIAVGDTLGQIMDRLPCPVLVVPQRPAGEPAP
jgi:nucleotide-binding universal stress UspA family protein